MLADYRPLSTGSWRLTSAVPRFLQIPGDHTHPVPANRLGSEGFFNLFLANFNLINEQMQQGAICLYFQDAGRPVTSLRVASELYRFKFNHLTGDHNSNSRGRILAIKRPL